MLNYNNSYLVRTADQKGHPDEREIFNVCSTYNELGCSKTLTL